MTPNNFCILNRLAGKLRLQRRCMLRKSKRSSQIPWTSHLQSPVVRGQPHFIFWDLLLRSTDASLLVFRRNGLVVARDRSLHSLDLITKHPLFFNRNASTEGCNVPSNLIFFFFPSSSSDWRHTKKHCFLLPHNKGLVSAVYSGQGSAAIIARVMTWSHLILASSAPWIYKGVGWWWWCDLVAKCSSSVRHHWFAPLHFCPSSHLLFFFFWCSHLGRSHDSVLLPL